MSSFDGNVPAAPSDEVEKLLLLILRAELCGEACHIDVETSQKVLYETLALAKRHDLAHLAADHLLRLPLSDGLKNDCKKLRAAAQYRYFQQSRVLSDVSALFEKNGIDFIPLKGAVLRELYPSPWMRTCADLDILVREENIPRAVQLLEKEMGMDQVFRGSHDIKLKYRREAVLELHYRLVEDNVAKGVSRLLSGVWSKTSGESCCKRMTDEVFYLYHIVHMAKHFEFGGCGIRFFMDLWLLNHRVPFDAERRDAVLKRAELYTFAEKATRISEKWFSGAACDGMEHIEHFIVRSGSFGSMNRNVSIGKFKKGGTLGYLRSRLIVPYDYLKLLYPSLENRRYLTSLYEAVRWFRFVRPQSRSHTISEINSLMRDSDAGAISVLRDMGLL